MESAIVYKVRELSAYHIGLVRPIVDEIEGSFPEKPTSSSFPNNGLIFVVSGYDKLADGELYRLPHTANHEFNGEQDKSSRKAYGEDGKSLNRYEYLHVLEAQFDVNNRKINMPYKPDRLIMLKSSSEGYMYGPFDYDPPLPAEIDTYEVSLKPYTGLARYNVPEFHVLKFSDQVFEVADFGSQSLLVAEVKDILECEYQVVDYISDDQLLKIGNTLLQGSKDALVQSIKLERRQLSLFRNAIAESQDLDDKFSGERKTRLLKILDRLDYWTSQSSSLIAEYLQEKEGQEKVIEYIRDYKPEVFVDLAEEVAAKEFEKSRKALQKEIEEFDERRSQLRVEVRALEARKQETEQEVEESQAKSFSSEIVQLEAELKRITEDKNAKKLELEFILRTLDAANNILELKEEAKILKRINGDRNKENAELEIIKNELIKQINQSDDERKQKLMQVAKDEKPYLDILNGIVPTFGEEVRIQPKGIRPRGDKPDAKAFVQEVREKLKSYYGRDYDFTDIANFLICINQNFLTVFFGLPGVGKTSLITCLAGVLGLQSQDCFLNIPTARGFTSQRDILGFYNPLSQRFQPSATGLYEALSLLNNDPYRALYPYWTLLDEANLSPMEHYFSAFLGMCDAGVPKEVKTGEPGSSGRLTVPASFRFLATINYDNTTEPLSPRMIDRVPIIRIEQPKNEEVDFPLLALPEEPLLSYDDFYAIFSPPLDDDNGEELEARVLAKVKEALADNDFSKGIPTIVSPRKMQLIKRYCSAARELMSDKKYPLAALDYAVSQHILPLINGYGDKYRKRLEDLDEAIKQLNRSRSMLGRIIEQSDEEQKFYRYFI